MAAVAVTSNGYTFTYTGNGRTIVRTSVGIPYVVTASTSSSTCVLEIYKGNSSTPTSFSSVATNIITTSSYATVGYGGVSCAIDGTNKIHIVWMEDSGSSPSLMYRALNTSDDSWVAAATDIIADTGQDITDTSGCQTDIAVDTNDIPHVAYAAYVKSGGSTFWTVLYQNRIGGAWNASGIEIEGITAAKSCKFPQIAISPSNIPYILYNNETDSTHTFAYGNTNDAASFTLVDINAGDLENTSGLNRGALAVALNGDVIIAYRRKTSGYIGGKKHLNTDDWNTWSTVTSSSANNTGVHPQIVCINNTLHYFFYEEDLAHDIVYDTFSYLSTWGTETTLETGTFNSVKVNWAYSTLNLYGYNKRLGTRIADSYSSGTDLAGFGSDPDPSYIGQTFTGNGEHIKNVIFSMYTNTATTGNIVCYIYAHSGTWGSTGLPTGSPVATSDAIVVTSFAGNFTFTGAQCVQLVNGTHYVAIAYYAQLTGVQVLLLYKNNTGAHAGNYVSGKSGPTWSYNSSYDLRFQVSTEEPDVGTVTKLDYTFIDETASPDIWFNTLSLVTSSIKKCTGVTQATIKKVIGVTNATMKKLEGVTNT